MQLCIPPVPTELCWARLTSDVRWDDDPVFSRKNPWNIPWLENLSACKKVGLGGIEGLEILMA